MQVYKPKTAEKQHVLQFVSTFGHNAINNVFFFKNYFIRKRTVAKTVVTSFGGNECYKIGLYCFKVVSKVKVFLSQYKSTLSF